MPEEKDPTTGTTGADPQGGSGDKPTGTAGDAAAGGSGADTDDPAELKRRLAESERVKAQLLSEKSNVERDRKALEERAAALEKEPPSPVSGGTAQPTDPYLARIERLKLHLAQYPDDVVARNQLEDAYYARQSVAMSEVMRQAEADLLKVPAEIRDRVRAEWMSGNYRNVASATQAVRGQDAEKLRSDNEALRKRLEDAEKDAAARARVHGGAGTAPLITRPDGQKVLKLSEYTAQVENLRAQGKEKEARELIRSADSGAIDVING